MPIAQPGAAALRFLTASNGGSPPAGAGARTGKSLAWPRGALAWGTLQRPSLAGFRGPTGFPRQRWQKTRLGSRVWIHFPSSGSKRRCRNSRLQGEPAAAVRSRPTAQCFGAAPARTTNYDGSDRGARLCRSPRTHAAAAGEAKVFESLRDPAGTLRLLYTFTKRDSPAANAEGSRGGLAIPSESSWPAAVPRHNRSQGSASSSSDWR